MKQKKEEEYGSLIVACILKTRSVDNLKKTFIFMFVMIFLTVFSGTTYAECPCLNNTVKVYVDGSEIVFPDQKPFINPDNRTLVPVRFVSEALGAEVKWIGLTRTVIINYQGKTITLEIGLKQALVGTSIVTLDTNASIINDRTMVPLRFVSECLGAEVVWKGNTKSVFITTELLQPNAYQGTAYSASGLPVGNVDVANSQDPSAQNMTVTTENLPVKMGNSDYAIYSVSFSADNISVKQKSPDECPMTMYVAEKGIITRMRSPLAGMGTDVFTYDYDVYLQMEIADGLQPLDIADVSHVVFEIYTVDGPCFLTVVNPEYRG